MVQYAPPDFSLSDRRRATTGIIRPLASYIADAENGWYLQRLVYPSGVTGQELQAKTQAFDQLRFCSLPSQRQDKQTLRHAKSN